MQCYERQAMYLMLASDFASDAVTVVEIQHLKFDPNLLDEVLSEFSIESFTDLIALTNRQRREMIKRIKATIGGEARYEEDPAFLRDRGETEVSALGHLRIAGAPKSKEIYRPKKHNPERGANIQRQATTQSWVD